MSRPPTGSRTFLTHPPCSQRTVYYQTCDLCCAIVVDTILTEESKHVIPLNSTKLFVCKWWQDDRAFRFLDREDIPGFWMVFRCFVGICAPYCPLHHKKEKEVNGAHGQKSSTYWWSSVYNQHSHLWLTLSAYSISPEKEKASLLVSGGSDTSYKSQGIRSWACRLPKLDTIFFFGA